jgi:flagellar biogenesis protein FliO
MGKVSWRKLAGWLAALARSWRSRPQRQLRLCENLSLGERRFLSVVEFERQRFLVGGTGSALAMLAALPNAADDSPDQANADPPTWILRNGCLTREVRR